MDPFAEHFKLDVEVLHDRTRQVSYISDQARGVRRQKIVEEWVRQKRLGAGANGEVFLERSNSGKVRAVKEVRKSGDLSDYLKELLAMGRLSKDDGLFVQLIGWFESDLYVYLTMEYLHLGDISTCYEDPLSEPEVGVVGTQLLEGLAKMHEMGITHRDIKPQNILVVNKSPIWVKIGDFGVSKRIQGDKSVLITRVGTHEFAAPEILGILDNAPESSEYTNAVDIWSFGCVLYYLLTKYLPFSLSKMGLLWKYCMQPTLFPEDDLKARNVSAAGILFIKDLMVPQPSKRMAASAALAAPWIQDQTDSYNNNTEAKSAHLLESLMQDSVSQINDQSSNTVELTSSQDLNKSSRNRKALPLRPQDDKKQGGSQIALRPDIASKRAIQDAQATELLLQNGFDIHAVKFNANEALLWAATKDHEGNMVQLLLERGADVAAKDNTGSTALHWAAKYGHEAVIRLLFEKGTDVAAKDSAGSTALHWAATNGHEAVIRLLLEKGADVAAKSNAGSTALHWAATNGHEAVIRLLLEKGADVAAKNNNRSTALHWAATNGHEAVVRLLKPLTPDS